MTRLTQRTGEGRRVDVAVLGGGPAGSAVALTLARAGRSVVVWDRPGDEPVRVGESLAPEARGPLTELGVWERFEGDGHVPSPGITSAWGREALYENDFIVNPCGPGWQVDRRRFNALLARCAEEAGAEFRRGARPTSCERDADGSWRLEGRTDAGSVRLRARLLVDATGRPASWARRLGGQRQVHDGLVAAVGLVGTDGGAGRRDRRTLVEAVEDGWWYSAPLPDGRHLAAFMTDADRLPRGAALRPFWGDRLRQATHTASRLGTAVLECGLRVVSACSARLREAAGRGWLAVGDAAAAFDPLSGQGVLWALESGLVAARAAAAHLGGDRAALARYEGWFEAGWAAYRGAWFAHYGRERRWPGSPFWARRQG